MKASVLMSIYNETEAEIYASVMSVLEQSFGDYEFIIVHDNPTSDNKDKIINWLKNLDSRITIIENDVNIGLAMSMNKAFDKSNGAYIIRMDSDDICEPKRFEREINLLETNKWDMIFSNYTIIDANGNSLNNGKTAIEKKMTDDSLLSEIIFDGIIHHPTVAMTREIFIKAGRYRNFPCSQDLDLWLRMLGCGCRFLYINESLLKYRIRANSITESKRLNQHLTVTYIISLFAKRLKTGSDDYSDIQYNHFIASRVTNQSKQNFAKALNYLQQTLDTDNTIQKMILRLKAFCLCTHLRYSYLYKITHTKWIVRKLEREKKSTITIL